MPKPYIFRLEENKVLVRKGIEAMNRKDLSVLDDFMATDYVDHTNQLRGREDVKQFYAGAFKNISDLHRTIEDIIAEGDKVWVRFKITGTTLAGKKVGLASVNIFRIADGKVVEGWTVPQLVNRRRNSRSHDYSYNSEIGQIGTLKS